MTLFLTESTGYIIFIVCMLKLIVNRLEKIVLHSMKLCKKQNKNNVPGKP